MPELSPFVPTEYFSLDDGFDPTDPRNRRRVTLGLPGLQNIGLPDLRTGRGTFTGRPMPGMGPTRRYETPEDYPYPGSALEAILPEPDEAQVAPQLTRRGEQEVSSAQRRYGELRAPRSEEYKPGWKRALLGAGFGALSEWGRPGTGAEITRNVLMAPYRQATEEYERERGELERQIGLEDLGTQRERAAAQEKRQAEAHERLIKTPIPESPEEARQRRTKEADEAGLAPGSPERRRYILTGELPAEQRPTTAGIGQTRQVGNRIKQFNPNTGSYDIDVGSAPPERPARPSAGEVSTNRQRTVNQLAREALRNAGKDPNTAIQDILDSVDQGMIDPALVDDLIRAIRLQGGGQGGGFSIERELGQPEP